MIKKSYYAGLKRYCFTFYCDCCFSIINNGEINREETAIIHTIYDLCEKCYSNWKADYHCGKEKHTEVKNDTKR